MESGHDRGGNLYNPRILVGNWHEDREQRTIGTNDGLRGSDKDYASSAANAKVRTFESEVSVPTFSGERTACAIAPATRYKRLPNPDTSRVLADYGVRNERFLTTTQAMSAPSMYVDSNKFKKPIITADTFQHAVPRRNENAEAEGEELLTQLEEKARMKDIEEGEKRYWETTSRSTYKHPAVMTQAATMTRAMNTEADDKAGFIYGEEVRCDVLPFPNKVPLAKNQWGVPISTLKNHPAEHHIRTTTRLFVDYRGQEPPRLGITSPLDGVGPALPQPAAVAAAEAEKKRETNFGRKILMPTGADVDKKPGYRIWQDYDG